MNLIIFDIDGTLTDTKTVDDQCFIQAFQEVFGIDLKNQNWADLQNVTDWGITEEVIFNHYGRNPTSAEYAEMKQRFFQNLEAAHRKDPHQFKEVPGANAFFHHLAKIPDFELAIATGGWEQSARMKLEVIGINPDAFAFSHSDHFINRGEITRQAMALAQKPHGGKFEDILYFGDGEWDYFTCQELGIRFIGIDVRNNGKLAGLGAAMVFEDYNNQDELMAAINKK